MCIETSFLKLITNVMYILFTRPCVEGRPREL